MEVPFNDYQASTNNQIMTKMTMTETAKDLPVIRVWGLDIIWNLGLGNWNLTHSA